MPRRVYKQADIDRTLPLLEASRIDGGPPVWNAVAKATGIQRNTLKGWWHDAHPPDPGQDPVLPPSKMAPLHVLRRPNPATPEDAEGDSSTVPVDTIDIQATPELGYHAWAFGQIAIDIAGARDSRSYGALAPLRRQMDEHYLAARKLIEAETAKTGRTAAEVMAHLKATAEKMAPGQIAIFVEEAKRRRMV